MDTTLEHIRTLLAQSRSEQAIEEATRLISASAAKPQTLAMAYYLRGNAFRQTGDWSHAINNYLEAVELDPDGPAAEAYRAAQQVLNFYNHVRYNPRNSAWHTGAHTSSAGYCRARSARV